jgi:tyrosinase
MDGVVATGLTLTRRKMFFWATCRTFPSLHSTPSFGSIIGKQSHKLVKEVVLTSYSNVDRLIAIWQILHDDQWFVDEDVRNKEQGNFFLEFAHPGRATDNLRPFHNSDGKYFTSNDVREVTKLGYTYKGLERWLHKGSDGSYDKTAHLAQLRESLLLDYGSSWNAAQKAFISDDPGQNTGVGLMSFKDYEADPVDLIGVDDYVVDIVYEK